MPTSKIHNWSSLILEIENISCQHQYIACYRQFIISQISVILLKFEMQITHILYSHFIILLPLIVPGNHEYYNFSNVMERGFQWKWMLRENVGYYQNQVVRIDDTDFVLKYALGAHQSE